MAIPPLSNEPRTAVRRNRIWWRDRRVLVGVIVVLASAVAGSALIASARATDSYWVLASNVTAGEAVAGSQLRPVEISVPSAVAKKLVPTTRRPTDGLWAQSATSGTLLTEDLIGSGREAGHLLPFRVPVGSVPETIAVGDVVNVWVGPGPQDIDDGNAVRLLSEVPIVEVNADPLGTHKLLVADVGPTGPAPRMIAELTTRHVTVVPVR